MAIVPTPGALRPRVFRARTNSAPRPRTASRQTRSRRPTRARAGATLVVAPRWPAPCKRTLSHAPLPWAAPLRRPLFSDHVHGRGTGDHQRQPAGMAAKVAGVVANDIRPQHAVTA